jgi:hypothetical protein
MRARTPRSPFARLGAFFKIRTSSPAAWRAVGSRSSMRGAVSSAINVSSSVGAFTSSAIGGRLRLRGHGGDVRRGSPGQEAAARDQLHRMIPTA